MRHAAVEHPNGVEVPIFKEKISQTFENQYKNQETILNYLFQEEKHEQWTRRYPQFALKQKQVTFGKRALAQLKTNQMNSLRSNQIKKNRIAAPWTSVFLYDLFPFKNANQSIDVSFILPGNIQSFCELAMHRYHKMGLKSAANLFKRQKNCLFLRI